VRTPWLSPSSTSIKTLPVRGTPSMPRWGNMSQARPRST